MEAVFNQKELDKALGAAKRATMVKGASTVLSGVLIEAIGDRATFSATNYDIGIQYKIPARAETSGKVLVSGNLLHDLVKRMPGPDITLRVNENYLIVRSGTAEYKIVTMDPAGFPIIDRFQGDISLAICAGDLRTVHRYTAFSVSDDKVGRPVFSGINFACLDDALIATSTDTHQLARKTIPFPSESQGSVIIPPTVIAEVIKLVEDDGLTMTWGKGKVGFATKDLFFFCRAIDGQYPDVEKIIPKGLPSKVTIDRGALEMAIERISLISMEHTEKVSSNTMVFTAKDNILTITASGIDKGQAKEEFPVVTDGPVVTMSFNGSKILDCLRALDTDKIVFSLPSNNAPAAIEGEGEEGFIFVVAPIRQKAG